MPPAGSGGRHPPCGRWRETWKAHHGPPRLYATPTGLTTGRSCPFRHWTAPRGRDRHPLARHDSYRPMAWPEHPNGPPLDPSTQPCEPAPLRSHQPNTQLENMVGGRTAWSPCPMERHPPPRRWQAPSPPPLRSPPSGLGNVAPDPRAAHPAGSGRTGSCPCDGRGRGTWDASPLAARGPCVPQGRRPNSDDGRTSLRPRTGSARPTGGPELAAGGPCLSPPRTPPVVRPRDPATHPSHP